MNNDLKALIADYRDRTGESYGTIAARTSLSRATVYKIATQDSKAMARPSTIKELARAMSMPERVVRDAALVSAGIATAPPVEGDADRMELHILVDELPAQHVPAMNTLFRSLIAESESK